MARTDKYTNVMYVPLQFNTGCGADTLDVSDVAEDPHASLKDTCNILHNGRFTNCVIQGDERGTHINLIISARCKRLQPCEADEV